jgi:pyridoxamine 5'-phosphate oxidase
VNDIATIRSEFRMSKLEYDHLDNNPLNQFRFWLNDAIRARVPEPTAMTLATATPEGRPSARIVLLKDIDADGLTFFSNYESKKGMQLEFNPHAALVFFWSELERQVRIEGKVVKALPRISDEYFNARPEGSKIGAWASPQSRRIPSREYLENLQRDYLHLFRHKIPDRPQSWGGYRLVPALYEFWQGRENRLHDRFEYTRNGNIWEINRLAP